MKNERFISLEGCQFPTKDTWIQIWSKKKSKLVWFWAYRLLLWSLLDIYDHFRTQTILLAICKIMNDSKRTALKKFCMVGGNVGNFYINDTIFAVSLSFCVVPDLYFIIAKGLTVPNKWLAGLVYLWWHTCMLHCVPGSCTQGNLNVLFCILACANWPSNDITAVWVSIKTTRKMSNHL